MDNGTSPSRKVQILCKNRLLLAILCLVGFSFTLMAIFPWLTKVRAPRTVEHVYSLLKRKDYVALETHGFVDAQTVTKFKELEASYGKVLSFEIRDVYVQILGNPWGIDVEVTRESGVFWRG